ncbi:hypothetical protein JKP88DRAFT_262949 [Tribonema minus]|uniref:Uncharacterized protein n=1 Tax=Tribonema minus TaxID=303371 RepID=A0A835Z2A1_9STRA|nr:hypothetical protein JKP88DRAFT_262949 [Tribonema minus]
MPLYADGTKVHFNRVGRKHAIPFGLYQFFEFLISFHSPCKSPQYADIMDLHREAPCFRDVPEPLVERFFGALHQMKLQDEHHDEVSTDTLRGVALRLFFRSLKACVRTQAAAREHADDDWYWTWDWDWRSDLLVALEPYQEMTEEDQSVFKHFGADAVSRISWYTPTYADGTWAHFNRVGRKHALPGPLHLFFDTLISYHSPCQSPTYADIMDLHREAPCFRGVPEPLVERFFGALHQMKLQDEHEGLGSKIARLLRGLPRMLAHEAPATPAEVKPLLR